MEIYIHIKTCTWIFTEGLLLMAQTGKWPQCSSMGEWSTELVHPYHEIPPSNNRKNYWLSIHATTWMYFKGIMLSEKVNQKVTYCMIPFMWCSSNDKIREMGNRSVVAGGGGLGIRKGSGGDCKRVARGIHVMELGCILQWWSHESTHVTELWRTKYTKKFKQLCTTILIL